MESKCPGCGSEQYRHAAPDGTHVSVTYLCGSGDLRDIRYAGVAKQFTEPFTQTQQCRIVELKAENAVFRKLLKGFLDCHEWLATNRERMSEYMYDDLAEYGGDLCMDTMAALEADDE